MTRNRIPLIDIAPFRHGGAADRDRIAGEIDLACRDIGFFLITGHGVDEVLIERAYEMARRFFEKPLDEKREIKQPAPSISRGYTPMGGESLAAGLGDAAPPDLKEMIDIGPVDVPGGDYYERPEAGDHFHPNLWPSRPVPFRETMVSYYRAMNGLADELMAIFAHALELPPGFFTDKLDKNMSALRLLCYPEQKKAPAPGQLRGGSHTDYGTLTILTSDQALGGLQAQHRDGSWVDVLPAPGSYVVNIGDAMQVWTNDRWVSTLHRVVNPPRDRASLARRHAMPFFHQPNYDAIIDTLPSCITPDRPRRYPPMTFGAHWMAKWMATK